MSKPSSTPSNKSGLPPGSLIHVGDVLESETSISVLDYNKDNVDERRIDSSDEIARYKDSDSITWVIVEGLKDVDIIERIGVIFNIHPLVLEDILNTHQRAKFEEYENYLYIVLKCLSPGAERFYINYEQVSILLLENCVLVFKEKKDTLFQAVQKRIITSNGKLRSMGADYLTYTILDTIVDQYFTVIDALDDAVTPLEDNLLLSEPTNDMLLQIQRIRREVIDIRRNASPIRDLLSGIIRTESPLIGDNTHIYFRDVYDHAIRVTESIESYRDIMTGLLDIYISSVNNRMNEVMKVLTVFASIFIPLTFLVGIYGMNFEYMPELKWRWAYPGLWLAFIIIPTVLVIYFKRKKWL